MSITEDPKIKLMKKAIRAVSYPFCLFVRCFRNLNSSKPITYYGVYKNFNEAQGALQSQTGYLTPEYLYSESKKVTEIVSNRKNVYAGNYRDRDLLLLLAGMPEDEIRILDVGSGFGLTFHYLIANLNKKIEYTALDLPEVISIANKNFAQYPNFHSSTFESLAPQPYDLVNFGSSLQYFEDYRSTLFEVLVKKPKFLFIADTPVSLTESFVTLQVNMKDRKIPRWVFSLSEIIQIFKEYDYNLVASTKVDWHSNIHNFLNFPEAYHHIKNMNLIFEKINTEFTGLPPSQK
jgi:putative methyltransferase (TIGR04325 family)